MCLLAVIHRTHPDFPLIVAANRDEMLDRPAEPMGVLRDSMFRVLGGRDKAAGGTWLAVNEHGVAAGLTNKPRPGGRDPSKRSRGELPLFFTDQASAARAVEGFVWSLGDFPEYNPCWLLIGDRETLYTVDLAGGKPSFGELSPGIHVLENRSLEDESPKAELARLKLEGAFMLPEDALISRLEEVLRSHDKPAGAGAFEQDGIKRPAAVESACVHHGGYGTRSSTILLVPRDPKKKPLVRYADGPPCGTEFRDFTGLWE